MFEKIVRRYAVVALLAGAFFFALWLYWTGSFPKFFSLTTLYGREAVRGGVGEIAHINVVGILGLLITLSIPVGIIAVLSSRFLPAFHGVIRSGAGGAVRQKLDKSVVVLDQLVAVNSAYVSVLGEENEKLEVEPSANGVQAIVVRLLDEHQRMRSESARLAQELEERNDEKREIEESLTSANRDLMTDALSGLGNRRAFDTELASAIEACRISKAPLSLIMADIDNFKRFNDTHGHPAGDEIIKLFGAIVKSCIRGHDYAVRYGGEEFAIIASNAKLETAKGVADRIRKKLESKKLTIRQTGLSIGNLTASFGVAEFRFGDTGDTLVLRADAKLYAAKSAGRNKVVG